VFTILLVLLLFVLFNTSGDGGGGPTRPLLERLARMENTDQVPVIDYQTPVHFFNTIEEEGNHPVWVHFFSRVIFGLLFSSAP
jgi:alpha-mannosidase